MCGEECDAKVWMKRATCVWLKRNKILKEKATCSPLQYCTLIAPVDTEKRKNCHPDKLKETFVFLFSFGVLFFALSRESRELRVAWLAWSAWYTSANLKENRLQLLQLADWSRSLFFFVVFFCVLPVFLNCYPFFKLEALTHLS